MTDAIKIIGEVKELGIDTFKTAIRVDQNFVKAQISGDIGKKTKAHEDILYLTAELLELNDSINQ